MRLKNEGHKIPAGHPELCVGCQACVVACMDENDIVPEFGGKPLCRVEEKETAEGKKWIFRTCRHCSRPRCMEVCPAGCFKREEETGLILLEKDKCTGCGACEEACPFHGVFLEEDRIAKKCNGCMERVQAGYLPACIRACPWGAVSW